MSDKKKAELLAKLRGAADRAAFEPHLHHAAADCIEQLTAEVVRLQAEVSLYDPPWADEAKR